MDFAWSHDAVTVRDVVDALQSSRRSAYTTIMTVMNRLVDKGMLRRRPDQQSYRYSAAATKEAYLERTSRQAVSRFVEYFGDAAIAQFIDVLDDVDPKKVAELRRKLRRS